MSKTKMVLDESWTTFVMSVLQTTGGPIHHSSSDHYYSPPHGPKEGRNWSPHMDSYELMVSVIYVAL